MQRVTPTKPRRRRLANGDLSRTKPMVSAPDMDPKELTTATRERVRPLKMAAVRAPSEIY